MNPVFVTEIVADVHRTLIDVHIRARGAEKCRGSIQGPVGGRYELQQALGRRASRALDLRSFGGGQNGAGGRQALMLPQPLVAQEEEGLPLDDWTADITPELIALQSRLRYGCRVEEVSGIEIIVPKVVVSLAVELVGSRTRGDIHDRAGIPAGLRTISRVVDFEFGHGVDGRLECHLVLQHVIQVDAVNHEVHRVFAAPGGIECKRSLAAQRCRQKPALRRRHRAWYQQS